MEDHHQFLWEVPVLDPRDRDRHWRVGVRDGHVITQPPPGEGFRLSVPNAKYGSAVLEAAAQRAEAHDQQLQPVREHERWLIPVLDTTTLRPRKLIIEVAETRVMVILDGPGDYVVPPTSIDRYCDALRVANIVAERRKGGYRHE